MLDDTHFHAIANATLMHFNDQLEQAYDNEDLDELELDEGAGILTIITPDDTTFVISKHEPSHQIWLASPLSGGLHFDYDTENADWRLADGRTLKGVLLENLKSCANIDIAL